MNNKVYIVTAVEYSDYHIEAAFSTKENAEAFMNAHDDDYCIEEYKLDEQKVKEDERLYRINFYFDDCEFVVQRVYDREDNGKFFDRYKDVVCFSDDYHQKAFIFYICSDSKEKAKKIAKDRVGVIKALKYEYPLLFVKCVKSPRNGNSAEYPKYGFYSKEILLEEDERIVTPLDCLEENF